MRGARNFVSNVFLLPDRDVGDCLFDNFGDHEKGWWGGYLFAAVQLVYFVQKAMN